jgi:hypothetical protein
MPAEQATARQRGQVLVIMALALVALMGITGVAVDLGYAYTHRREVQNAADAAALAGAIKLGTHYNAVGNPSGALPTPTPSPQTDATIKQDITNAAMAALPPFPSPNTNLTWPPSGTTGTNTLTAYYLTAACDTAPPATHPSACETEIGTSASAPPATAVGVRVVVTVSYPTFFARVMGPAFSTVPVMGQARAMLRPAASAPGGPFIVCGGGFGSNGANVTGPPGDPDVGAPRTILTPQPAGQAWTIGSNYIGNVFMLQGSHIQNNNNTNCGDNGFHGNADASAACTPSGSTPLPCTLRDEQGTRAGPTRNLVAGLPGCADINADDGCVVILPIADRSPSNTYMEIVTYGAFTVYRGSFNPAPGADDGGCSTSTCHTGVLLGAVAPDRAREGAPTGAPACCRGHGPARVAEPSGGNGPAAHTRARAAA